MRKKVKLDSEIGTYLGKWLSLSRFINDLGTHGARYNNRASSIMTHPQPNSIKRERKLLRGKDEEFVKHIGLTLRQREKY